MTTGPVCSRCGTVASPGARFCGTCGGALSASAEVAEDQILVRLRQATLGEYDVLRELGRGGMAAVYLAWDRDLARHVAVKVLLPELAHHPGMSQRFLQEARTAANLDDHPSVVRVYRAKEADGLRYFVMKYIDGCSVEQMLRTTGPLPADLAAHVVDQVAMALQYAHEHGVVHRDVKPGNILLDRAGGVVVTDFGIAKVAESEHLTRTGLAIGTPHYMSPEQWRVEPITASSDQYALGVVAHQLVAGVVPFDGTQYEVQEGHLRLDPPTLTGARPDVPAAFEAVVSVMLAKRPDERFPDLHSVSRALAAVPRDPVPALRARLAARIAASLPDGTPVVTPAPVTPATPPLGDARADAHTPANVTANARADVAAAPSPATPAVDAPRIVLPPPAVPAAASLATPVPATPASVTPASVTPASVTPVSVTPAAVTPASHTPASVTPAPATPVPDTPASVTPAAITPAPVTPAEVTPGAPVPAPIVADVPHTVTHDDAPPPAHRRRSAVPALAALGVVVAVGAGFALTRRTAATTTPAAPVASAAPPLVTDASGQTPAGVPSAAAPVDTTAANVMMEPPDPEEAAAPPEPVAPNAAPRVATSIYIAGPTPDGRATLTVGDSLRLRARVNDARGGRMVQARVMWASADPGRVAYRSGWIVGLAPGGPVDVTAASGALRRAVQVQVLPRAAAAVATAPAAPAAAADAPSAEEVQQAVQGFVAALRSRDVEALGRRLAPVAGDGSASRDFLDWMRNAKKFGVDGASAGTVSMAGGAPRVAVRVPIRYARGGLLNNTGRRDATFYLTLTRDGGGWHAGQATLASRFAP